MFITNFKQDEFGRKSLEPFLNSRPSTNLLNSMLLEENNRVTVCKVFIESLKVKGKDVISSSFHLDWAMECLAYAFALPLTELPTIKTALKIYSDWLIVESTRPKMMESRLEHYRSEIIGHLSLVFYKREDLVKQSELCMDVLNLYQKVIRYTEIGTETWLALVQLNILISDYISIYSPSLADFLSSKFLKVFFEVLLGAKTLDESLWTKVKKCLKIWVKNENLVNHWTSVTCGLTKAVISMLYLNNYNEIEIVFDHSLKSPDLVKVLLDDHVKVFYWYKFNDLLLDESFCKSQDPVIQTAISHSIHTIIDLFLNLCEQREKLSFLKHSQKIREVNHPKLEKILDEAIKVHNNYLENKSRLPIPSINSIMRIYGKWLFMHAFSESAFDPLGKSELISVLCRIFSVAQGPSNPSYLSNFFRVLLENLKSSDKLIIGEILREAFSLISYGPEAIKLFLFPNSFIHHLNTYLCDKESDPQVKFPCYMILSIISPICNKFQSKVFNHKIVDIYSQALGLETDDHNFWLLIWSLFTFAATIKDDQDSLHSILCIMIGRIESFDYRDRDKQKFLDMIEAIAILPFVINKKLVTGQIFRQIISNLLAFVPIRTKKSDVERTTVLILVLSSWLDKFPEAFLDDEIKTNFFVKVLENSSYIDPEFSQMIVGFVLNNLDRTFRSETGSNLSSYFKPTISNFYKKHFIIGNSIISAYQNQEENGFLIRNPSGLYSWKIKKSGVKQPDSGKFELDLVSRFKYREYAGKGKCQELFNDLDTKTQEIFKAFQKRFNFQQNAGRNTREKIKRETPYKPNKFDCNFHRSFLGQLGLMETSGHVSFLNNERFSKIYPVFDSINEKELIQFPLFYLETPEDNEAKALSPKTYHKTFQQFLRTLGSLISKESLIFSHFSGVVNRFKKVVYCNLDLFESLVIFPDIAIRHKKDWLFTDFTSVSNALVLWNQRSNDQYSNKVPAFLGLVDLNKFMVVILTSINEEITKVNIFGAGKRAGPLLDLMIVPNDQLAVLLHFTIYNHVSTLKARANLWKHRLSIINSEKAEFGKNGDFYSSLFE